MIDNWKEEAEAAVEAANRHLQLRRERREFLISGAWKEHELSVEFEKGKRATTRFTLSQKHVFNTSFRLSRQGVIDNLFGPTYQQDVIIGAEAFDDSVVVEAWKTTAIKELLQCEEVREASLQLFNDLRFLDVDISNRTITVSVQGFIQGILEIESILYAIQQATIAFDQAGDRVDQLLPIEETDVEVEPEVSPKPEVIVKEKITAEILDEPVVEAAPEYTEADYQVGNQVHLNCRLRYITPTDTGWLLVAKVDEAGVLDGGEVRYLIGETGYKAFSKNIKSSLTISGEVTQFDPAKKQITVDLGEPTIENKQVSVTVAIRI